MPDRDGFACDLRHTNADDDDRRSAAAARIDTRDRCPPDIDEVALHYAHQRGGYLREGPMPHDAREMTCPPGVP